MYNRSRSVAGGALCLLALAAALGAQEPPSPPPDTAVVEAVVRDLCGKRVALLGESPTHGSGTTVELKVAVVRRLVRECHFEAFFIESPAYDFLKLRGALRSGGEVTEPTIAAAIGGLWANREMQPLVTFLLERARRGALVLGGLDDQLARDTWAQHGLGAELTRQLPGAERARCLAVLQRHIEWQYTDAAPYGRSDRAGIVACLDRIEATLRAAGDAASRDYDLAMAENLRRNVARDFPDDTIDAETRSFNGRDRSMYANFRWLYSRLPPGTRVIVWCANIHAAGDLRGVPGYERRIPLGAYIHRELGSAAFALGATAYSGAYALGRHPPQAWPQAPPASLESRALEGSTVAARYLGSRRLRELGPVPSRALGTRFAVARWDRVLDGMVDFRQDVPPHPSGP